MFPAAFEYVRARSSEEALAALAAHGADARILAGGQSLIPAMRYRLARPAVLVDINPIAELAYIKESGGMLAIGALTRDFALEQSALIASNYLLMDDVSAVVADPVVRQMGTVVGSLCHNDPAGDWRRRRARLACPDRRARRERRALVAIDDFLVDSYTTSLADGEMAVEVRFPTPDARTSGAYFKSRAQGRRLRNRVGRRRARARGRRHHRECGRGIGAAWPAGRARWRGRETSRRAPSRAGS